MVEEWHTITELSETLGIPETTARRYAKRFSEFLPSRKFGRVKKYRPEAGEILEQIAHLYGQGSTTPEVKEALNEDYTQTIDVGPKPERPSNMLVPLFFAQQKGQEEMKETLQQLNKTLGRLEERLEKMERQEEQRSPWWKFWER